MSPELLAHAQRVLTAHIGPIARVVVKRCASRADSPGRLFQLLCEKVADGPERARLLRQLQRRA